MSQTLTVVIPAFNAQSNIADTIAAAVTAIQRAPIFDADILLVDDGSTDDTAAAARRAVANAVPLRILTQPNRGRFEARRVGIEAATADWILLLDSRLELDPDALGFVGDRLAADESVWTGHVEIDVEGNPYGTFWKLLAELAWAEYFENPRTTSFGITDFDRFPKGTGCFLASRALLLEAIAAFRSRYADLRHANDDGPLIRWIAGRNPVHISPEFSGRYVARSRLAPFVRHSFHRGVVFLDGHGRSESRFFPVAAAFFPLSLLLARAALRRPLLLPGAAVAVGVAAGALAIRHKRAPFEVGSLAVLAPLYAAAHGAGMWRGLGLLARDRVNKR